ncbi:MAG: hypothetical protein JKY22_12240 [Flavobacteriaceae bacterium]|nr:hypothetical protein [Flavobacteriaceae bacterium]
MNDCDHDWEMFEEDGYKQCTYPDCQIEQTLDAQDYEDILIGEQNFEIDQAMNN